MNPTSIEKTPRIYEVPTLLVKPQRTDITPINVPENYYFQYIFNFNLNNVIDTSSCNLYPLTRKLNSSGNITYSSRSVDLNGSSYLSRDIDFDLKTFSFWFNLKYVNIDNYLLSTDDNDFYIKVNSTVLSIKVNTDIINITNDFIADNWYHLALTYNESGYDIYSNNSILDEKIDNLISNPIILNIGKKSAVPVNPPPNSVIQITPNGFDNYITTQHNHSMVAIKTDIYIFGGYNLDAEYDNLNADFNKINTINCNVVYKSTAFTDIRKRYHHSMVAIGTDIYIYGGETGNTQSLNDFYKIDTINCNVVHTDTNLAGISARYSHSMVAIDTDIYIFGGKTSAGRVLNDFYKIDTINCNVTEIVLTGSSITARGDHSMVAIDNDIYIFGGTDFDEFVMLNDFYKIDTEHCNVVHKDTNLADISRRYHHSMIAIGTDIYIFGGEDSAGTVLNDFYKIDTIDCNVVHTDTNLAGISARYSHSMVAIDTDIYIYGGAYNGTSFTDFYKIATAYDSYFTGNIADLRLYNYSITQQAIQDIKLPEPTIYIQYDFDNTLNKSSSSIYEDSLTLISNGDIQYYISPISVYLNESSYLSKDIDFDIKSLSFWFKLKNVNDNYLLSFDNDFYIKVNSTSLEIQNDSSCNIETSFNSNIWYNLVLNYNNTDYDIYLSNIKLPETIDYKELTSFTLNIGKYSNIGHFTGNIADLRLYNHSITAEEITTIYNDSVNSMEDIIHTKTFSGTIPGDTNMLDDVPEETTILNIVIDSEAILYNENYHEGSGLYINFYKPNLRNVGQVNIINNGKIYGRGGIGQTFVTDNRYIGKYAIKVLSYDSKTRIINITNIGDGVILGGDNGGTYRTTVTFTYRLKQTIRRWYTEGHQPPVTNTDAGYTNSSISPTMNVPGTSASYFDGNKINDYIRTDSTSTVNYVIMQTTVMQVDSWTTNNLNVTRQVLVYTLEDIDGQYYYSANDHQTFVPVTKTAKGNTGPNHPGFDETKDIEVPNDFIIVNKIP